MIIDNKYIKYKNEYHKIIVMDINWRTVYNSYFSSKHLFQYTEDDITQITWDRTMSCTSIVIEDYTRTIKIQFEDAIVPDNEVVEHLL